MKGYRHNSSFPKADVHPQNDTVPTADEWLEARLDALGPKVVWVLRRRWLDAYCSQQTFTPEEAARCAYSGQTPGGVRTAFRTALGFDGEPLLELFAAAQRAPAKKPELNDEGKAEADRSSADVPDVE